VSCPSGLIRTDAALSGGGCPGEEVCLFRVGQDAAAQLTIQVHDRGEGFPVDDVPPDLGESEFDLVEP